MKIIFASCFDALEEPNQTVWQHALGHSPDVLLLLGDSIYMDYFPHLGQSKNWSKEDFAKEMYRRYKAQWEVDSFRVLVNSVKHIGITWDDHDFAWNGSCGAGTDPDTGVPKDKRLISTGLFLQFKQHLKLRPIQASYPAIPNINSLLNTVDQGIQDTFDFGRMRFIMLDGRTYRQDKKHDRKSTMLGENQKDWLKDTINGWNGVSIVCTGSTIQGSKESWSRYNDYDWLISQNTPPISNQNFWRSIFLSGDIHENNFLRHKEGNFYEITSSGAARPNWFGAVGNYGLLEVHPTEILVTLFNDKGQEENTKSINF